MTKEIEKSLKISNKILTTDNFLDLIETLKIENQKEERETVPYREDILSANRRVEEIDRELDQLESEPFDKTTYREKYRTLRDQRSELNSKIRINERFISNHTPANSIEITTSNETITLDNYDDVIRTIRNEKVIKIKFSFSLSRSKKLNIKLESEDRCYSFSNYISVSGTDEEWVRSTYDLLKNTIGFWQNQFGFAKYRIPIFILLFCIPVTIFFVRMYVKNSLTELYSNILLLIVLATCFVPFFIIDKISEIFPCIELQTGPKNLHFEEGKRNKLVVIVLSILVPIIIAAIFFILSLK